MSNETMTNRHISADSQLCNWHRNLDEARDCAADYFKLDPQVVSVEYRVPTNPLNNMSKIENWFIHRDGRCQNYQFDE